MKVALPYLYPGKTNGQSVFEETFAEKLENQGVTANIFYPSNKELRKVPKFGTILTAASLREHYHKLLGYDIVCCSDGFGIALLEGELSDRVVPIYHCSAQTQRQKITINEDEILDLDNYRKYEEELLKLELVPPEISDVSHEAIAMISVQMAKNANQVVAVSNNVKNELIDLGAEENKIAVIENGIRKQWFQKESACPECDDITKHWSDKPVVIWMGRTGRDRLNFKIKGVDRILEVMENLDSGKVHKVVVALVPHEKEWHVPAYKKLFEKRGIQFIPNWPYEHLPHLVSKANIQLMTSRYEACQLSLLEGMASGLAPVAYQGIGIVPEALQHNKNGLIVEDIDEMIAAVNKLISDPELTAKLGQAAQETAKAKHRIDDMVNKYITTFEQVAGDNAVT